MYCILHIDRDDDRKIENEGTVDAREIETPEYEQINSLKTFDLIYYMWCIVWCSLWLVSWCADDGNVLESWLKATKVRESSYTIRLKYHKTSAWEHASCKTGVFFLTFFLCLGSFLPPKLISFVFRRAVAFLCFWVLCMLLRLSGECDNRDNASSLLELISDFFVTKKPQQRNDCSHCYQKQSLAYWKSSGNFAQETYCFCSISFLPPVYVNWIRCCFFSWLEF